MLWKQHRSAQLLLRSLPQPLAGAQASGPSGLAHLPRLVCEPCVGSQDLREKIDQHYRVRLILDNLPITTYDLEDAPESIRPGFQESFAAMFPAPRQRWVDALTSPEDAIRALPHETLVIHGREDKVIPLATSLTLAQWIPNAQLHVFGHCGHWTQIEHSARFARLVADFLAEADAELA